MLILNETALDRPGGGSSVVDVCPFLLLAKVKLDFPRCADCSYSLFVMFSGSKLFVFLIIV